MEFSIFGNFLQQSLTVCSLFAMDDLYGRKMELSLTGTTSTPLQCTPAQKTPLPTRGFKPLQPTHMRSIRSDRLSAALSSTLPLFGLLHSQR